MVDEEGKEMRKRGKNLKERIELCIKEGGSSNNSLNKLIEMIVSILFHICFGQNLDFLLIMEGSYFKSIY